MREIWKPVRGYKNFYEVSNLGRVRSLDRRLKLRTGIYRKYKGRIRRLILSSNGYYMVFLNKPNKKENLLVHRVVYEAFTGRITAGLEINHKDRNRLNNCSENLEAVTHAENQAHAFRNGRVPVHGESHPHTKISSFKVSLIKALVAAGEKNQSIAAVVGVTPNYVSCIRTGRRRTKA